MFFLKKSPNRRETHTPEQVHTKQKGDWRPGELFESTSSEIQKTKNKPKKRKNVKVQSYFDILDKPYLNNDITTSGTKLGLSDDKKQNIQSQIKILKLCAPESSADALMQLLNRTHKTRFKNDVLNPLLESGFLERTIPEKPKSPKQKYRLTGLFVRADV
jgi:hypothetical protein